MKKNITKFDLLTFEKIKNQDGIQAYNEEKNI